LDEFTSISARFCAQSRALKRTLTAIHKTNRGFGSHSIRIIKERLRKGGLSLADCAAKNEW
jgi:hypothetical protein